MVITYSPEFWSRAYELHDRVPKQCSQCRSLHKATSPDRVIVRLVCLTPDNPTPESLDLRCTKCHRDPAARIVSRKLIVAKVAYLFPDMEKKGRAKRA